MSQLNERSKIKQDNLMKHNTLMFIIVFLLVASTFACLLPYPFFSDYTNITKQNAYEINNHYETELNSQTMQKTTVLNLSWFSAVDAILPNETEFEILDIKTESSFFVIRTGGKNHADIETINNTNTEILHEIFANDWSWERRPVLVKLNENCYIPASLSGYPHGHSETENGACGHFCLHFKGSKTHGTNRPDSEHQKCIKSAEKSAKSFLTKIS